MSGAAPGFPITLLLPQVLAALASHPRLVLEAPPGAGKTTQVPLALLAAPWLAGKRLVMLEPRRVAARAAAQFMARQRGEEVGATVGYRIRFESRVSAATRIEVVTEGILTRMLQDDPELPGVGALVFDEFHERHLAGDLGAALALDVQANLRADLRLVVMSATLDGERIARWLDATRLSSPGRSFAVAISYPPARTQETLAQHVLRVTRLALAEQPGDVLAFLPGRREIAQVQALLEHTVAMPEGRADAVEVVPLHGDLSVADQQRALAPAEAGMRRIVLATNIAESSVTAPGIRAVIDSGLAREPRFDPNSGFTRLETVAISQASADQRAGRAGRAGRVAAGAAYRLWPQSKRLDAARTPEIAQVELSGLALELAAWGSDALPWLDAPPAGALAQARDLLRMLGALDEGQRITASGRRMLALGAAPRLAAAACRAPDAWRALAADLLALLEARSPLRGEASRDEDFRTRLAALHAWRDGHRHGASGDALAAIERGSRLWRQRLGVRAAASGTPHARAVGDLLLAAFPDRIAHADDGNPLRYTLANGRGARLRDDASLRGEPWLVVVDVQREARDSLILAAAPFDPDRLDADFPQHFATRRIARWNPAREAAEAFEERCFDAIVLARRSVPVQPEDALPAMLAAIRARGLGVLPWSDVATDLRQRIAALRMWMPELGLPEVADAYLLETLETWLAPFLAGQRSLAALPAESLTQALAAPLDHAQRRALDREAPARITVPSGRTHAIDYRDPAAPVLAVKLQELFGLADTPAVAGGRVPLTLHLQSPAGRPMQVTRDLRSFWEHTYPEVRKELKGRYPRHPWPEDPWSATPTHRTKPRQR